MASPLGLGFDNDFTRKKASYKFSQAPSEHKDKEKTYIPKGWSEIENSKGSYEQSLFNEASSIAYFPKVDKDGNVKNIKDPHSGSMDGTSVYDVRTKSIIDWSQGQSRAMKLYAKDFAYLRYLGVYPNNRLIICRKFGSGIGTDLSS